ncbi:MAG: hypothetical protein ACSW8J_08595 [bacterium]
MIKKLIAALLAAAMLLGCAALAQTYRYEDDLTFTYDENCFEIATEDHTDDEDMVVLNFKDAEWGDGYIRIHLRDMEDGEKFPTLQDFAELEQGLNTQVTQGEWNGYKDVFMYDVDDGDTLEATFIVPIYDDDDREVEDILTVKICVTHIDDEETAMARDDRISEVVDTLKVLDD